MLRIDLLLVELSEDEVSDVIESVSSLVGAVGMDSWHVLMSGDIFYGCISTPPPPVGEYICMFVTEMIVICIFICFE
jgi:hypothetical protein